MEPYKKRRDDLHYSPLSFVAVSWHTVMSWMMKVGIQRKEEKGLRKSRRWWGAFCWGFFFFFYMKTTGLLILTNMFSLCATVIAAPHGCLKQPAKRKRQVNEGVGLFISTALMSAAQLMHNKENCVRPPSYLHNSGVFKRRCDAAACAHAYSAEVGLLLVWVTPGAPCDTERLFPFRAPWLELIPASSAWYKL